MDCAAGKTRLGKRGKPPELFTMSGVLRTWPDVYYKGTIQTHSTFGETTRSSDK